MTITKIPILCIYTEDRDFVIEFIKEEILYGEVSDRFLNQLAFMEWNIIIRDILDIYADLG